MEEHARSPPSAPSTSRHLKRLSLAGSLSSPGSQPASSPESASRPRSSYSTHQRASSVASPSPSSSAAQINGAAHSSASSPVYHFSRSRQSAERHRPASPLVSLREEQLIDASERDSDAASASGASLRSPSPTVRRLALAADAPLPTPPPDEATASPFFQAETDMLRDPSLPGSNASDDFDPSALVQIHSELLTVIAKKERRVLDLREELKQEEREMSELKARWQTIVAQARPRHEAPSPASSPSLSRASRFLAATNPAAFRELGIDLSDPANDPQAALKYRDLDANVNVQAAKRWVGNVLDKVLGVNERGELVETTPSSPPPPARSPSSALVPLDEADEGQIDAQTTPHASAFSEHLEPPSATPSSSSHRADQPVVTRATRHDPVSLDAIHSRRRSTFGFFGNAAGGSWKKLSDLANSESFRASKRATINMLDTFENALADTLGPLDPAKEQPQARPSSAASPPQIDLSAFEDESEAHPQSPSRLGGYRRPSQQAKTQDDDWLAF